MNDFDFFNKINMPIYVCNEEWRVLFRNTASRRYTTSPRVNGNMTKCFVNGEDTVFPEKDGGISFVACRIGDSYKIAMLFEYKANAIIIFPMLLEYDLLFGEYTSRVKKDFAKVMRSIFDVLSAECGGNRDKYGVIEKLRSYYFGAIESYVAFALFDNEKRVLGDISRLYEFFLKNIIKVSNKTGLKIETNLSSIESVGKDIYTDTLYFTFVLAGMLLFGVELSEDRKCRIEPIFFGESIRHSIKFTCKCTELYGRSGSDLKVFKDYYPIGYFNVLPYEALCSALGWKLYYGITDDEELNCTVYFDIDHDNEMIFRSAGESNKITAEELVADIISKVFLF